MNIFDDDYHWTDLSGPEPVKLKPYKHQIYTIDRLVKDDYVGPLLDMGLGKTASALTAIDILMFVEMSTERPLIIAPKRVAESVWPDEIAKWAHLKHLTYSLIAGSEKQRKIAIAKQADIYIISYDNIVWLIAQLGSGFNFDLVYVDESSKLKNPTGKRFGAVRMVRPKISKMAILTGSPTPNGMGDLWSQIYLLDQGERLGKTVGSYRREFFNEESRNNNYDTFKLKRGSELEGKNIYEKLIMEKVNDIVFSMKAKDYLQLPPCIDNPIKLQMVPKLKEQYDIFERDLVLSIEEIDDITAMNAAVLTNKLRQFANGAVYDADRVYHEVHNLKIDALIDNIEEANGQPMMVFYQYQSDWARIQKYLKHHKPKLLENDNDIKAWNRGEIQLLCAHPGSVGHGLNLQHGGHFLTWFGRDFNLDYYTQGKKRLDRPGQKFTVTNSYIMIDGTIDDYVDQRLKEKDGVQENAMDAVKAIRSLINKWKS